MFVRSVAVVSLVIMFGMLTACAPDPEPSPSAPVFATEAEAFAAAEETYRAYVDALNQVDLSDPATFEEVYAWTTGDALANERKTLSQMHADGWTVTGESIATVAQPMALTEASDVTVATCLDVSGVDVVDAEGQSVVSQERTDIQSALATLTPLSSTPTGFAISAFESRIGEPYCE